MSLWKAWQKNWDRLFHEHLRVEPIRETRLPLSLVKRFQYAHVFYRGIPFVAAMDLESATPDVYRQYLHQLEKSFEQPVVFFLHRIPSYQKGRMIKANIPFMTIDGYAYMPQFYTHLKTSEQRQIKEEPSLKFLSPIAQVLLLRHFLFDDVHGWNLRQIGRKIPYSAMSLSNAKNELVHHGLCRYDGALTRGCFNIVLSPLTLWEKALPLLRSPVQKQFYAHLTDSISLPLAGESALSKQTLLADGDIPTYAIGKQLIRQQLLSKDIEQVFPEDANSIIQQWMYPPEILMRPGDKWIDPVSLYLSLQDSSDDRIIQELHQLPIPCSVK